MRRVTIFNKLKSKRQRLIRGSEKKNQTFNDYITYFITITSRNYSSAKPIYLEQ